MVTGRRVSSEEGPRSCSDVAASEEGGGIVVAGKPFYPEVIVSHMETPSKFYVLELTKKDTLDL